MQNISLKQLKLTVLKRNFQEIDEIFSENEALLKETMQKIEGDLNILLYHCCYWNMSFLNAYYKQNKQSVLYKVFQELLKIGEYNKGPLCRVLASYDEKIVFKDSDHNKIPKTVFEIFPELTTGLLMVKDIPEQKIASKQIVNHKMSLVLDEVGTGKSVTALYAINEIIKQTNYVAKILIICPPNLRTKWQQDIRRQLGRYAHIVEGTSLGRLYDSKTRNVYFQTHEHQIFIVGNRKNMLYEELRTQWDLIVIDEAHEGIEHFKYFKASHVMLLTATPIKISSNEISVSLDKYKKVMEEIIKPPIYYNQPKNEQIIDPINIPIQGEQHIFVQHFREDFEGENSVLKRKIYFKQCYRQPGWQSDVQLIAQSKGHLVAMHYAQDDKYLSSYMTQHYKKAAINIVPEMYGDIGNKYMELLNILKLDDKSIKKSYIVFCEHIEVVDALYKLIEEHLLNKCIKNIVVAKKNGKIEASSVVSKSKTNSLLEQMKILSNDHRIIFITTGLSSGTGLNLGYFDGVIHYELPYTSTALEQRFGRIDRLDTKSNTSNGEKEMYFLINKAEDGAFFQDNLMLYYCVFKILSTCKFIPVRNTVIFSPLIVKELVPQFERTLSYIDKHYVEGYELSYPSSSQYYKEQLITNFKKLVGETEEIDDDKLKKLYEERHQITNLDIDVTKKMFFNQYVINYEKVEEMIALENEIIHMHEIITLLARLQTSERIYSPSLLERGEFASIDLDAIHEEYEQEDQQLEAIKNRINEIEQHAKELEEKERQILKSSKQNYFVLLEESKQGIEKLKVLEYQSLEITDALANGIFFINSSNELVKKSVTDFRAMGGGILNG